MSENIELFRKAVRQCEGKEDFGSKLALMSLEASIHMHDDQDAARRVLDEETQRKGNQ